MLKQIIINNKSKRFVQFVCWLKKYFTLKKSSELLTRKSIAIPYNKKEDAIPPKIKYFTADSNESLL